MRRLRRVMRSNILCSDLDRRLLYRIMHAQVSSGMRINTACEKVMDLKGRLKPALTEIAEAGAAAADEGRQIADGWRDTDYLPEEDLGLLEVSEDRGTLNETLEYLSSADRTSLGLFRSVVAPNIYSAVLFLVGFTAVFMAVDLFAAFPKVGEGTVAAPVLSISEWLQRYATVLAVALTVLGLLIARGRSAWTGVKRRLLLIFDEDWRFQLGLRFCHMAETLFAHGATTSEVIDAAQRALGSRRYTTRSLNDIRQDVVRDGRPFADALSGRILTPELAACLQGMVPEEDPRMFPAALDTLAKVYQALLEEKYRKWQRMLNVALLLGSAGAVLLVAHGVFSMASASLAASGL